MFFIPLHGLSSFQPCLKEEPKSSPAPPKVESSRFCENAAPQRPGPPDLEGDPVPHTRRPPPKHTKATRASVPPTFTETLLKYSLCTKNYPFPTPFRICIAFSSTFSVQCCPGIPGITPQAAHTLQGEAVPLCCQWHTEHWPFIPGLLLISHSENNVHTFPFPRIQQITVPSSKNPEIQFLPKINGKINTT